MANNLSSPGPGTTGWFQGNTGVFSQQAGTGYAAANFNSGTGVSTLSNWLITPIILGIDNGTTFTFFTRTVTAPVFPDRLQVRGNFTNTGTDVGATATSIGDFTTLLLDINPTYTTTGFPDEWTEQTATVTGLSGPVDGRFAFRYFVEDGGPVGSRSDYFGIDSLTITTAAIPEPSVALFGLALLGAAGVSRRRSPAH